MSNRVIKFRGKRIDNNEWAYGYYVYDSNTERAYIYNVYLNQNDVPTMQRDEVLPESVGQFSEFKDKNGIDICESDISKVRKFNRDIYSQIRFINGSFFDSEMRLSSTHDEIEIVGNAIEHPHLLQ